MSYILQALKKSQQDRELGQVPTLTTAPDGPAPIPPQRVNPWSFGALILALTAVLIALYGSFGERLRPGDEQIPPLPRSAMNPQTGKDSGQVSTNIGTGDSRTTRGLVASPPRPPAHAEPRSGNPDRDLTGSEIDGSPAGKPNSEISEARDLKRRDAPATRSMGGRSQAATKSTMGAAAKKQVLQPDADAPALPGSRSAAGDQTERQRADSSAPPGRQNYSEFLRSEAERLRERLATVDPGPVRTPSRETQPPRPARTAAPPAPALHPNAGLPGRISKLPGTPPTRSRPAISRDHTPPATVAVPPRPPLAMELPPEIRGALPKRQIIAHIYSKEPARRFIIVNSVKLHEGDKTVDGLLLQEVRPDGIVFQFRNHRFFEPR